MRSERYAAQYGLGFRVNICLILMKNGYNFRYRYTLGDRRFICSVV